MKVSSIIACLILVGCGNGNSIDDPRDIDAGVDVDSGFDIDAGFTEDGGSIDLCVDVDCGEFGSCDLGFCDCTDGYTGDLCDAPPVPVEVFNSFYFIGTKTPDNDDPCNDLASITSDGEEVAIERNRQVYIHNHRRLDILDNVIAVYPMGAFDNSSPESTSLFNLGGDIKDINFYEEENFDFADSSRVFHVTAATLIPFELRIDLDCLDDFWNPNDEEFYISAFSLQVYNVPPADNTCERTLDIETSELVYMPVNRFDFETTEMEDGTFSSAPNPDLDYQQVLCISIVVDGDRVPVAVNTTSAILPILPTYTWFE